MQDRIFAKSQWDNIIVLLIWKSSHGRCTAFQTRPVFRPLRSSRERIERRKDGEVASLGKKGKKDGEGEKEKNEKSRRRETRERATFERPRVPS